MTDYYPIDIIPIILNRFKVKNAVISGLSDEETINQIFKYCNDNDINYVAIDSNSSSNEKIISDYTLNILPNLTNYDAIFLNDDPNWYTVFNELKIINKSNDEFPLVFLGHNIFPHKRRDSYINPEIIPEQFLNKYSKELIYKDVKLRDNYFHAIEENTPKNGVLTAIEDFIKENPSIDMMNIKFINGITILYPKNNISKIRMGLLNDEISKYKIDYDNLSDDILKNQILSNHISKFNMDESNYDLIEDIEKELDEKNKKLNTIKNKIEYQNSELNLKKSQIQNYDAKLELKEVKLKNIESKLVNRNDEINKLTKQLENANNEIKSLKTNMTQKEKSVSELNHQLVNANNEIKSLKTNMTQKEKKEIELNNQLKIASNQIEDNIQQLNNKTNDMLYKDNEIRLKEGELNKKEDDLTLIKHKYTYQLSKLDNKEYCINCFKEEIENNRAEIEYLKKDTLLRKLLRPLAYIYLILKSKPKELKLNYKLYRTIKNSKCFDIGFYLNNNKDILKSNWCKYFSPELHYICKGFEEQRKFNKKYFNRNSKQELLEYILNCKY